jgi:TonB family protein
LDFSGRTAKAKKGAAKASATAAGAAKGEGSNTRVALLGGLVFLVLLAGAWYENWLPFLRRTSAVALPAGGGMTPRPRAVAKNAAAGSADASQANATDGKDAAKDAAEVATAESATPAKRAERGAKSAAKDNDVTSEQPAAGAEPAAVSDGNGADAVMVPAKLVKSVQAVYPPDAMRNYITGDVIVDAVVKPDGRIGEMNVVTGPAALRQAALDALKQYEYAAATQGGKAVASHVKVTVKFWFNP